MSTLTHDYPGTVKSLIRALEDYIRLLDAVRLAEVRHGFMTVREAKEDAVDCQRYADMLEELQAFHCCSEVYQAMQVRLGRVA